MKDSILGTDATRKVVSSTTKLDKPTTLEEISQKAYSRKEFWPLVAAINMDRGYYDFPSAKATSVVPSGAVLELWQVSRYFGQSETTIVQVSAPNIAQANEELLSMAQANAPIDIPQLQDQYRPRELTLLFGQAQTDGIHTLRELAIKYYGNARFWPILVWANPSVLRGATEERRSHHKANCGCCTSSRSPAAIRSDLPFRRTDLSKLDSPRVRERTLSAVGQLLFEDDIRTTVVSSAFVILDAV
jgi:hypothetical protein